MTLVLELVDASCLSKMVLSRVIEIYIDYLFSIEDNKICSTQSLNAI
jgi:hypothetical protein